MDAKSLDRNSPVPLYVQIEDFIRHEIAIGAWKPGERIPSEAALNTALGVSRMTVRGVLNGLVDDGTQAHPIRCAAAEHGFRNRP